MIGMLKFSGDPRQQEDSARLTRTARPVRCVAFPEALLLINSTNVKA